jgi:hypothetical protein
MSHGGKKRAWRAPWEAMLEIREHPPPISKTLMASSLGGGVGSPGVPTTFLEDVDGAPPLGGDDGDPGAFTTFLKDVDGGTPRRRCQRFGSVHHLS